MPSDQITLLVTAIVVSVPVIIGGLAYATEESQLKNERIAAGAMAFIALGIGGWSGYELLVRSV